MEGVGAAQGRPNQIARPWEGPLQRGPQLAPRRPKTEETSKLNVGKHCKRLAQCKIETLEVGPIFHRRNCKTTNLRKPVNPKRKRPPPGVSGVSKGRAIAHSGCTRIKDLWCERTKDWKSLSALGLSYHTANKEALETITNNIPWRPDEQDNQIEEGDWIAKPTPTQATLPNGSTWYLSARQPRPKCSSVEGPSQMGAFKPQ
ncbi:unnamed protein product [Sphagnum troendelagicum]|uniref:Uncharacterized protein n=1 Tax=Sphagnum troendelagicum TaxID=128251 RepID=A0ABP0TYD6_9BRYO